MAPYGELVAHANAQPWSLSHARVATRVRHIERAWQWIPSVFQSGSGRGTIFHGTLTRSGACTMDFARGRATLARRDAYRPYRSVRDQRR